MEPKQEVIDEDDLVEDVEPSETFAGLIARVGGEIGVGSLGVTALRDLVRQRTAPVSAPDTPPDTPEPVKHED